MNWCVSGCKVRAVTWHQAGWLTDTGLVLPESTVLFASEKEAEIALVKSVIKVQEETVAKDTDLLDGLYKSLKELRLGCPPSTTCCRYDCYRRIE